MQCRLSTNRTCSRASRAAFSVAELLVTIGVISLLVALMVPAVLRARASADSVSCRNQLRQLSLAASQYEATFGSFPSGRFFRQILPFVEMPVDQLRVPMFACPGDRSNANGDVTEGRISYSVNNGLGSSRSDHLGIFPNRGRTTRASEITDGLSNTALVAERLSRPWYAPQVVAWDERRQDWKRTVIYFRNQAFSPDDFETQCGTYGVRPVVTWIRVDYYHHLRAPNSQSCVLVDQNGLMPIEGDFSLGISAGSLHSGGVFVSYCDGSANFVSDEVSQVVWRAQGTRSGGEAFE